MSIPDTPLGARVRERLASERLIWLVTVGADFTPQPNPVWFWWDAADPDTVLIYNRSDAFRLQHIGDRPNVSLHFDADSRGMDVAVLAGTAHRLDAAPLPHEHEGYLAKYASSMAGISGSPDAFGAEYPVAVEVTVRRVRGF